jgi:hypothetical protein
MLSGRRLPIQPSGYPTMPTSPGEYCGPVDAMIYDRPGAHGVRTVFFVKRNGLGGFVHSPPHKFTENADGTLTIHPEVE